MNERLLAKELKITKFRSFVNVDIPLGRKMTVISGVNGVGKSNILSLIASGSGLNKKSQLANNFQPEFTEFFNIDTNEPYSEYKIYIKYSKVNGEFAIARRLSFKDDTAQSRGIRIIPRATNVYEPELKTNDISKRDKALYDVGGSGRVKIPTIYTSLSRLYPLGEKVDSVKISKLRKNNLFIQMNASDKYREWYNFVIPGAIKQSAELMVVDKEACSRASLHMDITNTPTLSQSIGQDNIGNIISALADLYLLSKEDDYSGSLFCIDEIEVSLHPDTQIRMLDLLDQLADELNIQIIVSTHSLTVLKECLKKEKKNSADYKVIYLKNPSAPMMTQKKSYDLLKADMFGKLSFTPPKVRIYFEDVIGQEIFIQLMSAYKEIYYKVKKDSNGLGLRNNETDKKESINKRILKLADLIEIEHKLNMIITHIGCESLMDISNADDYFRRVIIMLDGDARIKEPSAKPLAKDYMTTFFNPKDKCLNERSHKKNVIFAPNYFAPESYLYRIIMKMCSTPLKYSDFWRGLDENEATMLYTPDKIKNLFRSIGEDFSNNDLKKVFGEGTESEAWKFVLASHLLEYFYSDYETINELLAFMECFSEAYKVTLPLTLSNRYV